MKNIELKLKGLEGKFLVEYTKRVVGILDHPQVNAEVNQGKPSEEVSEVLKSLGYSVESKKRKDGSVTLIASRAD